MPATLRSSGWQARPEAQGQLGVITNQKTRFLSMALIANASQLALPTIPHGDLFEFGVYTGGGLRAWTDGAQAHGVSELWHTMWGFDSFEGLPESDLLNHVPDKKLRGKPKKIAEVYADWSRGSYNAADALGIYDWGQLQRAIVKTSGHKRTHLLRGFFNVSLPALKAETRAKMRPAAVVDIDCDIYEGTMTVLGFLFEQRLVQPGTIFYYDDWEGDDGEARAHKETSARLGLRWRQLSPKPPHKRVAGMPGSEWYGVRLFQLLSMGQAASANDKGNKPQKLQMKRGAASSRSGNEARRSPLT